MIERVTAERVVAGMTAFVIVWEAIAPDGQLLSEAFDRWMEKFPIGTPLVVAYTCAHLLNQLPVWADMFHWVGAINRWVKK